VPTSLTGWGLLPASIQIQGKGIFQLDWTRGHAMRLNSRTGIKGSPVSSLNCDRSLHSGLKTPKLVMHAMLVVEITDGPPPCARDHRTVVLSCSHLAMRWTALERRSAWLFVDVQVKVCSRETHSPSRDSIYSSGPSRASKIYWYKAFQITHIHTTVINSVRATLLTTAHTVGLRCGASLSADCGYNPGWCRSHPTVSKMT